jgi:hypothetical protein
VRAKEEVGIMVLAWFPSEAKAADVYAFIHD